MVIQSDFIGLEPAQAARPHPHESFLSLEKTAMIVQHQHIDFAVPRH